MKEAGVSPKMASYVADTNKGVNFGKLENMPMSQMKRSPADIQKDIKLFLKRPS